MTRSAAIVVGINNYTSLPTLHTCVNDAKRMQDLLRWNGGDQETRTRNFDQVVCLTSEDNEVNKRDITREIERLFQAKISMALFYFSGHGWMDKNTGNGGIFAQDASDRSDSIEFANILNHCRAADITSKIIILDCCNSGGIGGIGDPIDDQSFLPAGTTILTSSLSQQASEQGTNGLSVFTELLQFGLDGGAADLLGRVTPASLYANIDQSLGPLEQRPVFKANVHDFTVVRKSSTSISEQELRKLPVIFEEEDTTRPVGPWMEPHEDRGVFREKYKEVAFDPLEHEVYRTLQAYRAVNLVVPNKEKHMWDAAMNLGQKPKHERYCELTAAGKHYWRIYRGEN